MVNFIRQTLMNIIKYILEKRIYLIYLFFSFFMIFTVVSMSFFQNFIRNRQIPEIEHSLQIANELNLAYIKIEAGIINHDKKYLDLALQHIDLSEKYAKSILNTCEAGCDSLPEERRESQEILEKIQKLKKISVIRFNKALKSHNDDLLLRKNYYSFHNALIELVNERQKCFIQTIGHRFNYLNLVDKIIVSSIIVITIITFLIFYSFEKQQKKYIKSLYENNLKLEESEALHKALIDGFDGYIYLCSKDGAIQFVNKKFIEKWGEDYSNQKCYKLLFNQDEVCSWCRSLESLNNNEISYLELLSPLDNEWYQIIFSPVIRENGNSMIMTTLRNITEKKSLEEQLKNERDNLKKAVKIKTQELQTNILQLQKVNNHKDAFLADISHELRTPLTSIIGFSDLLKFRMYGDLNQKQLEYVDIVGESGKYLLHLINDLLDLSKINSGTMVLSPETFNISDYIEKTVKLIESKFLSQKIILMYFIAPELDSMYADKVKCQQVLLNLLSNAVKFTPQGGKVTIKAEKFEEDKIKITVSDNGLGIKPEDLDKIFDEFYQTDAARDQSLGGAGIGLALSRNIVNLHQGEIYVTSELNKGSSFWFVLPLIYKE